MGLQNLKSVRPDALNRVIQKRISAGRVDRVRHVIRGISAMQSVEALGHGFHVDSKTLAQVAEFGNVTVAGVKSRYTHPGLSADGLGRHLGRMKAFRVSGDKVLADLHFAESAAVSPEGDLRSYVEGLAEEDPEAAGMSIVAYLDAAWQVTDANSGETVEILGSRYERPDNALNALPLARLQTQELASGEKLNPLRAVDLVDEPAANREGMFSAGTTNPLCVEAFAELDRHADTLMRDGQLPASLQAVVDHFCEVHGVEGSKAYDVIDAWRAWRAVGGDLSPAKTPPRGRSGVKGFASPEVTRLRAELLRTPTGSKRTALLAQIKAARGPLWK